MIRTLILYFLIITADDIHCSSASDTHGQGQDATKTENGAEHNETKSCSSAGCGSTCNTEEHHEEARRFQVAKFDFGYIAGPFIVAVWILYASGAKVFFHAVHLSKIFPESCLLIVIGVILGIILYFAGEHGYELNTTVFFLIILPPIIFDAGYFMPTRPFFDNLGTILLYAIFGTLFNTLCIGFSLYGVYCGGGFKIDQPLLLLHALVFASLLAAVDPVAVLAVFETVHVNDVLYIVVFGESLLNDGISVVLYHLFEGFSEIGIDNILAVDIIAGIGSFFVVVFGATGIGVLFGFFGGFVTRFTHHVRVMEPLVIFIIGYISFLVAEMFHLSGILSCTFCGIAMRKYAEANISPKSQTTVKYLLKMMASVSETVVFMYLGISAVSDTHHWDTAFVLLSIIFCLLYRTIGVILQTYFANYLRVIKLNKVDQFIMAYGGLRGAIAFALVVLLDKHLFFHRKMFITTTVAMIYFTNLVMGTTIQPLVKFLRIKRSDRRKPNMNEKIANRLIDHMMAAIEGITAEKGHHHLRERFSYINNKYIKPYIIGKKNPQRRGWEIFNVYKRLNEKHTKAILEHSLSVPSLTRMYSEVDLMRTSSIGQLISMSRDANWWGSTSSIGRNLGRADSGSSTQIDMRGIEMNDNIKPRAVHRVASSTDDMNYAYNKKKSTRGRKTPLYEQYSLGPSPYSQNKLHVYRRHMLSTTSLSKVDSTDRDDSDVRPETQTATEGQLRKNVSFVDSNPGDIANPQSTEDGQILFVSPDGAIIADGIDDDDAPPPLPPPWREPMTDDPVPSQRASEKYRAQGVQGFVDSAIETAVKSARKAAETGVTNEGYDQEEDGDFVIDYESYDYSPPDKK